MEKRVYAVALMPSYRQAPWFIVSDHFGNLLAQGFRLCL